MPPADPAALASAVATVRNHWAEPERYSAVYLPALELIARHFLALLDAGELVRVRGLEWKPTDYWSQDVHADTVFGRYSVWRLEGSSAHWRLTLPKVESPVKCDSIEYGKAQAEAHYRSRLAAALEPLIPTETAS